MSTFGTILGFVSYSSVAVFVASLVACGLRRWRLATALSRYVALAGVGVAVVMLVSLFVLRGLVRDAVDPTQQATLLSRGVSETINCGALAVEAALPAAVVWGIARRYAARRK